MHANDLPDEANVVRYIKPTRVFEDGSVDGSETVLKLILPLLSDALLHCHSERSAAESKNLLPTQVEKMLRQPVGFLSMTKRRTSVALGINFKTASQSFAYAHIDPMILAYPLW